MTTDEALRILSNYLDMMPKVYRKRHENWVIVRDLILNRTSTAGRTSCIAKCRDLGIDPYGHDLELEENVMEIEKVVKKLNSLANGAPVGNVLFGVSDSQRIDMFCQAAAALEKQVPKPPEYKVHEKYKELGKNYYCECGVMFVDFERNGTNFCGNCGQRLKENK